MKTQLMYGTVLITAGLSLTLLMTPHLAQAQNGGSVTPGTVTQGTVTQGTVTQGTVTPGTVTPGTVTPGTVKAVAGDREIHVSATGAVSVDVAGADAKVKIDKHVLEVQKGRLIFDDKDTADMDPNIKKVEVSVQEDMLSVKGDGKEVFRVKIDPTEN